LKLFFIVDNNQPHASGGGYYAPFKFAEFLAKRGHEVSIYAVSDFGWAKSTDHLTIIYRPSIARKDRIRRKLDKFLSGLCDYVLLRSKIWKMRPDWILGVLTDSAIKASRIGREFNIPVANFVYECPPWIESWVGSKRFKEGFVGYTKRLWTNTREAYLYSDVLFPNSELSRTYNQQWLDGKIVAEPIFPGIDPDQMPYEAHENHRNESGTYQLLYVGRLAQNKNVDLLIQSVLKLRTPAILHICGEGPDNKRLQEIAGESSAILFHGYVSDADLWSRFRTCDLVLFPSSFEGFGMPPMQALYFGKPCLVADIPIFRSLYGNYLEYFTPGHVEGLSGSIERLLSDPAYRYRRGQAGRVFVLQRFSWSSSAERIEKILLSHTRPLPPQRSV